MPQAAQDFGFVPDPSPTPTPDPFGFVPDPAPVAAPAETTLQKLERIGRGVAAQGINMVGTGGGAAMGAALGTLVEPGGGTVAGGMAGGAAGNVLAQKTNQALGLQGGFSPGQVAASAIGGMVPGGSLASAPEAQMSTAIAKNIAANTAAVAAQTTLDERRAPSPSELGLAALFAAMAPQVSKALDSDIVSPSDKQAILQLRNSLSDQSLAAAQQDGYKFPASIVNPDSGFAQAVEGLGGKADLRREFNSENQENTNEIAKADIGLPPNRPITAGSWDKAKAPALAIYKQVQAALDNGLPPPPAQSAEFSDWWNKTGDYDTSSLLTDVQKARDAETSAWQDANSPMATNRTNLREAAVQKSAQANAAEQKLQGTLQQMGQPDLFNQYTQARTQLAKVATYKNVWNKATGDISAGDIGTQFENGKPFTGGLAKIGNANLVISKYTQDAADQLGIGGGKLSGAEGATVGALVGGIPGAIAGKALGMIGGAKISAGARALAGTDWFQNTFAKRQYGTPQPEFMARLAQQATLAAGRPNVAAFANQTPAFQPDINLVSQFAQPSP